MTTLVIVDVQHDFCEGGSLACEGGYTVARRISNFLEGHVANTNAYDTVIASRDFHHANSSNGGHISDDPDFVDTWPAHCIQGTEGSEYALDEAALQHVDVHVIKGMGVPAYSVMEAQDDAGIGVADHGWDGVDVHVVGIATDYCVRATVLDFLEWGANVTVLQDMCAPVTAEGGEAALRLMEEAGAKIR